MPDSTPLDIRKDLTDVKDVEFPLRWGVLGAGNISRQWVLSSIACKGASIDAVAARELDRAKAFANNLNILRAYGSYQELVDDENIDIIYVGTKTFMHKEHTLLAIEAGKHVLCEKPLTNTLEEAESMYAAAEAKGVMLQDAMWTRFFPAVEHARSLLEENVIGEPLVVHSDFFDPIYVIQAAPLAFGTGSGPTSIKTNGRTAHAAILDYEGKRAAVLSFPPFNSELPEVTEIFGTEGRITLGRPAHCPTDLTIHLPPKGGVPSQYRTRNAPAPRQHFHYPLPENVSISAAFPNQHGFLYQTEAVHRCLAAGLRECPQYSKEESLHCMSILTEINRQRG